MSGKVGTRESKLDPDIAAVYDLNGSSHDAWTAILR